MIAELACILAMIFGVGSYVELSIHYHRDRTQIGAGLAKRPPHQG